MARGRFISNAIISDKKINQLSDDTSRLAFTWLITTADAEGRTHGDPAMVRSLLFPRRVDVTVEQVEVYISEWEALGLIRWYDANGDTWIDFPNFEKYQIGLRKEREPSSQIPPQSSGADHKQMPEVIRQSSGNLPAQIKLIEVNSKLSESNDNGAGKPHIDLTDTQQKVLSSFGAKRFKNEIQRNAVLAWSQYPSVSVEEAITWAATKGFSLGQAIENITRALPNWNKPKQNGNGNGQHVESKVEAAIRMNAERRAANGNA